MKRIGMSTLAQVFTNGFLAQTRSDLQVLFAYINKFLSFQKWAGTDVLGYLNAVLKMSHVCSAQEGCGTIRAGPKEGLQKRFEGWSTSPVRTA